MKRFIWGIVLFIFGVIAILGSQGGGDAILGGLIGVGNDQFACKTKKDTLN